MEKSANLSQSLWEYQKRNTPLGPLDVHPAFLSESVKGTLYIEWHNKLFFYIIHLYAYYYGIATSLIIMEHIVTVTMY